MLVERTFWLSTRKETCRMTCVTIFLLSMLLRRRWPGEVSNTLAPVCCLITSLSCLYLLRPLYLWHFLFNGILMWWKYMPPLKPTYTFLDFFGAMWTVLGCPHVSDWGDNMVCQTVTIWHRNSIPKLHCQVFNNGAWDGLYGTICTCIELNLLLMLLWLSMYVCCC